MLLFLACQAPSGGDGAAADGLVINEVVPRNQSTWDDGSSAFPDWIELYNAGDAPVDLATVTLSDGPSEWVGSGDLEPGERIFVVADDGDTPGGAPFRLDGDGETLTLTIDGRVTDRVRIEAALPDVAWARHPDGGSWAETLTTTPDAPNPDTPSDTLDTSAYAFGPGVLHEAHIELSEDAYASLKVDRFTWVEGAVTLDGMRYAPVGVRLKSMNASRRTLDQKPGFKIDLDRYVDLRWHGMEALTLNNMVQDPTNVREHLTYTVHRAMGVPAPRIGWIHVSVNDDDHGLSLIVENPDDTFLARWYEDPTGALYEGAAGTDLRPGGEAMFDYDQGPDPSDHTALTAVIDALVGPADEAGLAALEELVDLDEVLTHMAVESVTLHWDGYKSTNNYRLYLDPADGRFDMLPWGADETWDQVQLTPWEGRGRLIEYCLAVPSCRARYDGRLVEVVDTVEALGLPMDASRVEAWLRPTIEADPRREYDMGRHELEMADLLWLLGEWPAAVKEMVEDG